MSYWNNFPSNSRGYINYWSHSQPVYNSKGFQNFSMYESSENVKISDVENHLKKTLPGNLVDARAVKKMGQKL